MDDGHELFIRGTAWVSAPQHEPPLEGWLDFTLHFTPPFRVEYFHNGEQVAVCPLTDHQLDLYYAFLDQILRPNPSPWTEAGTAATAQAAY